MQGNQAPSLIYAVNSVPVASSDDEDLESAETFPEKTELYGLDSPRAEDTTHSQVLYFTNHQLVAADAGISHLSVPGASLNFFTIVCCPDIAWVDKSIAIGRLREFTFAPRLPIIHRPSGFGKTAIADLLYCFYAHDGGLSAEAAAVFQHTHVDGWLRENTGSPLHRWIGNLPVLHFNLALLNVSSPDAFRRSLHRLIDSQMICFRRRFEHVIASTPLSEVTKNGHVDLSLALIKWLRGPKGRIHAFLCIDNYDYPEIESQNNEEIMFILSSSFISPLVSHLARTICDGVILGTRHLSHDSRYAEQLSMTWNKNYWVPLGVDVTDEPNLATLFGLTEEEIQVLCRAVGADSRVEDRILSDVPYETFSGNAMYCTREVTRILGEETGRVIG